MARIPPIDPTQPPSAVADPIESLKKQMGGRVINLVRELAVSPATLTAYLGLQQGLAQGTVPHEVREAIALGTAQVHQCAY